jgi:hypothetical protein
MNVSIVMDDAGKKRLLKDRIYHLIEKFNGDEFDDFGLRVKTPTVAVINTQCEMSINDYKKILEDHGFAVSLVIHRKGGWRSIIVEAPKEEVTDFNTGPFTICRWCMRKDCEVYGGKIEACPAGMDKIFKGRKIMGVSSSDVCKCGHETIWHNENGCQYLKIGVQCDCKGFELKKSAEGKDG